MLRTTVTPQPILFRSHRDILTCLAWSPDNHHAWPRVGRAHPRAHLDLFQRTCVEDCWQHLWHTPPWPVDQAKREVG